MADNSNVNNGLITKIWGPHLWASLHAISFGYPIKPTSEQKIAYKRYFTDVQDVLPCRYCRDSYKNFISGEGEENTWLTDEHLENRDTLTRWLYKLHNRVNKKLDVEYKITFEDVQDRYEAYRAKCVHGSNTKSSIEDTPKGCVVPLHQNPYKLINIKDCPVISYDIFEMLVPYLEKRGVVRPEYLTHIISQQILDNQLNDKRSPNWNKRNEECGALIKSMRVAGMTGIEFEGEFINFPTIDELMLISRFSTSLELKKLRELAIRISNGEEVVNQINYSKKYRLIK
jgi:hypothetical protein